MANQDDEVVMADEVEEEVPVSEAVVEEEIIPVEEAQVVAGEEVVGGPVRTTEGSLKAAGMGALNTGLYSIADDVAAALGFPGYRETEAQAKKDYPGAYGLGQTAGAIGTTALGGAMGLPTKGLAGFGTTLGEGALYGAGEAETAAEIPASMAAGAVGGAAGFGLAKAVPAIGKAAAVHGGSLFTGAPPSAIRRFLEKPREVMELAGEGALSGLSTEIKVTGEKLRQEVFDGSAAATDLLPKDLQIDTEPFRQQIKAMMIQRANLRDPRERSALQLLNDYISDEGMFPPGKTITPQDIKANLISLGKILQGRFGDTSSIDDEIRKEIRANMVDFLAKNFQDYEKAMIPLRYKADVLSDFEQHFGNDAVVPGKLLQMARNPERHYQPVDTLRKVDDLMKTDLTEENISREAAAEFEKARTQGSRRVLAGALMGGPVGGALGYATDVFGGPILKKGIEGYLAAKRGLGGIPFSQAAGLMGATQGAGYVQGVRPPETLQAREFHLPEALRGSKYEEMIESSKQRGEGATGATHFILMKNDPEYRKRYLGLDYTQ